MKSKTEYYKKCKNCRKTKLSRERKERTRAVEEKARKGEKNSEKKKENEKVDVKRKKDGDKYEGRDEWRNLNDEANAPMNKRKKVELSKEEFSLDRPLPLSLSPSPVRLLSDVALPSQLEKNGHIGYESIHPDKKKGFCVFTRSIRLKSVSVESKW